MTVDFVCEFEWAAASGCNVYQLAFIWLEVPVYVWILRMLLDFFCGKWTLSG
jgi:hypothetical protein